MINNEIMGLRRIKTKREKSVNNPPVPIKARDILLREAKHLFAQRGLSGTSIRDIARAAKMNSSQISYYFAGKEGLYQACIQDIAEGRIGMAAQILVPPASSEEYRIRLQLFADNLISYFLEDRDTGLIIIREYDRIHSPAEQVFKTYFGKLFELLIAFFKTAQDKKLTPLIGDPLVLTSLYFGMLVSELRLDHIKHGLYRRTLRDAKERQIVIEHIIRLL